MGWEDPSRPGSGIDFEDASMVQKEIRKLADRALVGKEPEANLTGYRARQNVLANEVT